MQNAAAVVVLYHRRLEYTAWIMYLSIPSQQLPVVLIIHDLVKPAFDLPETDFCQIQLTHVRISIIIPSQQLRGVVQMQLERII